MKTLRLVLVAVLLLAGTIAAAAPTLASSHAPAHSPATVLSDDQPTPTPTPSLPDAPISCSSGC